MELFGDVLLTKGGEKATSEVLQGKVIGIYFSAHWCPPCRGFTPKLAEAYSKDLQGKGLEIVFVSADEEEKVFEDVAMQEFQAMVNETVAEVVQPESIPEPVFDKENPMIAEAVKTVASKLGEQSIGSAVDCLSPQNLNVAQSLDLA